jgi:hypothetical protein
MALLLSTDSTNLESESMGIVDRVMTPSSELLVAAISY